MISSLAIPRIIPFLLVGYCRDEFNVKIVRESLEELLERCSADSFCETCKKSLDRKESHWLDISPSGDSFCVACRRIR